MSSATDDVTLMAEEGERQRMLLGALWQTGQTSLHVPVQGLKADASSLLRGEQAYRINAKALSERALTAVYPLLRERLGGADFAALAWTLWRKHPPERGDLACWGQVLPEFLAAQPGMGQGLVDQARLEWALHDAERAADASLDAASLQRMASHQPVQLRVHFFPGLVLLHLQGDAIGLAADSRLPVLVWREAWRGEFLALNPGAAALMACLLDGCDLEQALQSAWSAEADFDFSQWLTQALARGWLWRVEPCSGDRPS